MRKKVSVIIVNWNGKKHLQKCLPSLLRQDYGNIEVILVDNASTDGSFEYVKKKFPKVKIIVNKTNLGFAGANNVGYRVSVGEYVLFLNNDTRVKKDFIVKLISVISPTRTIGCVQSKILLMDHPKYHDSVGSFFTPTGFLYHYGAYKKDVPFYNKEINLYSARGACMMFRRAVLEKVKVDGEVFDSSYFAYFEETDLCHRVHLAGYTVVYVPASVIYHKLGGTSIRLASAFVHYHSYKNRINSYIKNLEWSGVLQVLPVHLILCFAISVMYLVRGKFELSFAIINSIIWNIKTIKTTFRKRGYVNARIRRVSDKDFLTALSKSPTFDYYYHVFFGDLKNYKEAKEF